MVSHARFNISPYYKVAMFANSIFCVLPWHYKINKNYKSLEFMLAYSNYYSLYYLSLLYFGFRCENNNYFKECIL